MPFADRATTSKALIHNPSLNLYLLELMDSKLRGPLQEMHSEFTNKMLTYVVKVKQGELNLIACYQVQANSNKFFINNSILQALCQ